MTTKKPKGFAAMNPEQLFLIRRMGGQAAHASGLAHEFTQDEAREAGRKGGASVSRNRAHMAAIGRKGALARKAKAEKARLALVPENSASLSTSTESLENT